MNPTNEPKQDHEAQCCVGRVTDHKCDFRTFCLRCETCRPDARRYAEASSFFAPLGQYYRPPGTKRHD